MTGAAPDNLVLERPRLPRNPWLLSASLVLLAYAVMGKGAAYIGLPPLFIGEFLLAAGIAALFAFGRLNAAPLPGLMYWLAALCLWGLFRTLPYVKTYGMDAPRDAVIWGYAAFAFIWFYYLMSDPRRFVELLRNYKTFAAIALLAMPAVWIVRYLLGDSTPRWPWAAVPVIEPKAGDVMVHLAGIFAFWISRPVGISNFKLLILSLPAAVLGAYERSGMFAFVMSSFVCVLFKPRHRALSGMLVIGVAGLLALAATNLRFEVPVANSAKTREVSFQQFVENITGVFSSAKIGDLDDTKHWRLDWWREIVNYTINGKYWWGGKGFGINLADDDGFQVMADGSLRSPHNAHMVILARAGVVGLALWTIVQLGWALAIFRTLLRCVREKDHEWAGVFLFLLAYWVAFIINATFDVYLEGPMGGIWFWTVYGVGVAALSIRRRHPTLLRDHANPYRA
jgi:hypothetical protein